MQYAHQISGMLHNLLQGFEKQIVRYEPKSMMRCNEFAGIGTCASHLTKNWRGTRREACSSQRSETGRAARIDVDSSSGICDSREWRLSYPLLELRNNVGFTRDWGRCVGDLVVFVAAQNEMMKSTVPFGVHDTLPE